MTYNAQGQRVGYDVSKNGVTSEHEQSTYRGDALAQAVISNTQRYTDTYLYDPNGAPLELLRQTKSGGSLSTARYWYVLNGHGDVVALTDVSGTVVDSYSYDLWGRLGSAVESVPQRLRDAGYWDDQELGWYWVSVRAYNPTLMRWLQPDPSQQDGVRTYVYVGDDPIDFTDPSGLSGNPPAVPVPTPNPPTHSPVVTATPGPSSHNGAVATVAALVTVGRWMSQLEYDRMVSTGMVQEPLNGSHLSYVTYPPDPESFLPKQIGDVFVRFRVPLNALIKMSKGDWWAVATTQSFRGRYAKSKGQDVPDEMPPAEDIKVVAVNTTSGVEEVDDPGAGQSDGASDSGGAMPGNDEIGGGGGRGDPEF